MVTTIPPLDEKELQRALSGYRSPPSALEALGRHYELLRKWSPTTSLIGPGTAGDVFYRHYGESLEALPWIAPPREGAVLVDVGSGAGFPGLVLAAAVPWLQAFLVESRGRKAAFLNAAIRKMAVSAAVIQDRVGAELPRALPARIDYVCIRAVSLPRTVWLSLGSRFHRNSRVLYWGTTPAVELVGLELLESRPLPRSDRRQLHLYAPRDPKE